MAKKTKTVSEAGKRAAQAVEVANFCASIIEAANKIRKQADARVVDTEFPVISDDQMERLRNADKELWDVWECS